MSKEKHADHIWYCAEFDVLEFQSWPPDKLLSVPGWRQFAFWMLPPGHTWKKWRDREITTYSPTGLTEYIYIGEL